MINHHQNFIFVHIPKCGGTSIESIFGSWANKYTQEYYHVGNDNQHKFINEILDTYPDCDNYFKFTFVRNPWARFFSEYNYMIKESALDSKFSFKDFCHNTSLLYKYSYPYHEKEQYEFIFDSNKNCLVDFVGRLESIQKDLDFICSEIKIPQVNLPHYYSSTCSKSYIEYYDNETRQIVAERYAKDIEYFGYKFGE